MAQEDVLTIAKRSGLGLIIVSRNKVEWMHANELPKGDLSGGGGYPSLVVLGQIFKVSVHLSARYKIFADIDVSYLPGGPFFVPEGEMIPRKITQVIRGEQKRIDLSVGIKEDAEPGTYPLYIERRHRGGLRIDSYDIQVQEKSEEIVRKYVANAIAALDHAVTTNIENALKQIDEAIDKGIINIEENITAS